LDFSIINLKFAILNPRRSFSSIHCIEKIRKNRFGSQFTEYPVLSVNIRTMAFPQKQAFAEAKTDGLKPDQLRELFVNFPIRKNPEKSIRQPIYKGFIFLCYPCAMALEQ